MGKKTFLDFEQPIAELESKIEELRYVQTESAVDISTEIEQLSKKSQQLTKDIYSDLSPWQITKIARHAERLAPEGHGARVLATAGDAAMAVLAAEKQARTTQAAKLAGDAPAPLPLVPAATVEPKADTRADLDAKAKAYQAAHPGTDYVAAVKAVQTL